MNRLIASSFAALLVVTVAACSDDDNGVLPVRSSENTIPDVTIPDVTIPDVTIPDVTIPDVSMPDLSIPDLSIPDLSIPDVSIPEDFEVTDEIIDRVVASLEQSGAKVDRECIEDALEDIDPADVAEQGESVDPEVIQRFISCISF